MQRTWVWAGLEVKQRTPSKRSTNDVPRLKPRKHGTTTGVEFHRSDRSCKEHAYAMGTTNTHDLYQVNPPSDSPSTKQSQRIAGFSADAESHKHTSVEHSTLGVTTYTASLNLTTSATQNEAKPTESVNTGPSSVKSGRNNHFFTMPSLP